MKTKIQSEQNNKTHYYLFCLIFFFFIILNKIANLLLEIVDLIILI